MRSQPIWWNTDIWLTASQGHPQDLKSNHQDCKGKGTTMKTEEETEHRERNKEEETHPRGKETAETAAAQGSVITGTKKKTYFAATCPKPKKEEGKVEGRSITPYPRSGDSSRDGCGGSQGGDTYIKVHSAM